MEPEPHGTGGQRPQRDEEGRDGRMMLLGRSHLWRPEAGDTLTMISHRVEISIARGGADTIDVVSTTWYSRNVK